MKEGFYWLHYARGDIAYSYVVYVKFRKTHSRLREHPFHTFRVYELGLTEDPSDFDELVKGFRFEDSVVGLGNVQQDKFSFFLPASSTSVRVFQGKILDKGRAITGDAHETRKSIEKTFHFAVETRDFRRSAEESPRNQGYHYNQDAETYLNVGQAMGKKMLELLKQGKE